MRIGDIEEANVIGTAVARREIPHKYKQLPVIGQGSTSVVKEKDPNTVLVFTRDRMKAEWLEHHDLGNVVDRFESTYNPTNPGIGQRFDIIVIEMPKLLPLSKENKRLLRKHIKVFYGIYNEIRMKGSGWGAGRAQQYRAKLDALIAAQGHFEEQLPDSPLLHVLNWAANYDVESLDFDFLLRNFMEDAHGTIIAVDPVVDRELAEFLRDVKMRRAERQRYSYGYGRAA